MSERLKHFKASPAYTSFGIAYRTNYWFAALLPLYSSCAAQIWFLAMAVLLLDSTVVNVIAYGFIAASAYVGQISINEYIGLNITF